MDDKDKDFKDKDANKDNAGDKNPKGNAGNDAGSNGGEDRKDSGLSWLTWVILSTVLALLLVAGGYLLYKRLTRGVQVIAKKSCPVAGVRYTVKDELGNVTEGFAEGIL